MSLSSVKPIVLAGTDFTRAKSFFQDFGFEYGKDPKVKKEMESVNRDFWEAIIITTAFCAVGFYLSPLGTLIYLAGIMPFTQWKVLGQFVAERYLYLPMVGWTLILAGAFNSIWMMPLFWAVVGLYIYRANMYIPAFKNVETLYENGVKNFPDCISNYVNLAERKIHIGELYMAFKLLKKGLKLSPESFLCHANLAAYWLAINQPEKGKYHTEMAMKLSENRGMAYNIFRQQLHHIMGGLVEMNKAKAYAEKILKEIRAETVKEREPELCGKP